MKADEMTPEEIEFLFSARPADDAGPGVSQEDIDSLLSSVETNKQHSGHGPLSQEDIDLLLASIEDSSDHEFYPEETVRIYDFRRPVVFSKTQILTIRQIHEKFAGLTRDSLLTLTGFPFHILSVNNVYQTTHNEFMWRLPNPSTLCVFSMDPLDGDAILEIDRSTTLAILIGVLGGSPTEIAGELSENLTDIENSLLEGVAVRFLGCLRGAWADIIDLRPRLLDIKSNPSSVHIAEPNDPCCIISFEVGMEKMAGTMTLCIPTSTLRPVREKLNPHNENSGYGPDDAPVKVTAGDPDVFIKFSDFKNLEVGDCILYESLETVILKNRGDVLFHGTFGVEGKQRTCVIDNILNEMDDDSSVFLQDREDG